MNGGLIPSRYAKALYKFAVQTGKADNVYEVMKSLTSAFEQNPDFNKVLANPFVSNDDKKRLLESAGGPDASDIYRGFVKLIIDNKREMFAQEMALAYRDIYRKANNISQVSIVTAVQMPEAEMDKLKAVVQKSFPTQKLEYTYSINPDIIGGFIINVDSVRMDASISNELEQLRLTLLSTK